MSITAFDAPTPLQICINQWRDSLKQNDRDLGAKAQAIAARDQGCRDKRAGGCQMINAEALKESRGESLKVGSLEEKVPPLRNELAENLEYCL